MWALCVVTVNVFCTVVMSIFLNWLQHFYYYITLTTLVITIFPFILSLYKLNFPILQRKKNMVGFFNCLYFNLQGKKDHFFRNFHKNHHLSLNIFYSPSVNDYRPISRKSIITKNEAINFTKIQYHKHTF